MLSYELMKFLTNCNQNNIESKAVTNEKCKVHGIVYAMLKSKAIVNKA